MTPSPHLSRFALDRSLGGSASPEADAHVQRCAECRARLDARRRTLDAIAAEPAFARGRARLLTATRPPPAIRRRWRWSAGALAVAAVAVVVWVGLGGGPGGDPGGVTAPGRTGGDGLRAKGDFALSVVRTADGRATGPFPPGAEVELRVGGWQAAALVLALDDQGGASVIWPPGGTESGLITADGRLEPRFRVTPGDLLLLSIFSATPIDAEAARRALARSARGCAGRPTPACSAPPRQPGELGRAWTALRTADPR